MAHISILIPSLAGGGAQRTALKIAGGFAGRGHRVDIVLFAPSVAYPNDVPETTRLIVLCGGKQWARRTEADMPAGAEWRPEHAPRAQLARLAAGLLRDFPAGAPVLLRRAALGRALRLVRYVERERPDILFANLAPAEYPSFFARRLAVPSKFPPIVPIVRNIVKPGTRHTKRRQMLFPEAAHVVAVSRGVADNVGESVGVPAEKITPIYNPTFSPDIARRAEASLDHPWFRDGGPPVILGVGRLAPQKDFATLIEAFRRASAASPCRLIVLGEGRLRPQLEGQVRALGLEDRVSLPGWVENPYAFMSRAALFVLSSRHEGFPGVLIESMACGTPVVSTDAPYGPAEILENGRWGRLTPVGDVEAMAQAILDSLAGNSVPAEALRRRAGNFSAERAVTAYEQMFESLIGRCLVPAGSVSDARINPEPKL